MRFGPTGAIMEVSGLAERDELLSLAAGPVAPVIATSWRTGMPVKADTRLVIRVTPAEGPSLGMAPSGIWICTS